MAREETSGAGQIARELRIAASPETVFSFLTDPRKMVRWMGLRAELDPRPGGIYRVDINGRDIARGQYVEVVPYSRVAFTFGWEGEHSPLSPGASTVEFVLVPDGDGTIVRFSHRQLPPAARELHVLGWDNYLPRLETVARGDDPGPDPWASGEMG